MRSGIRRARHGVRFRVRLRVTPSREEDVCRTLQLLRPQARMPGFSPGAQHGQAQG